jgi:hypothetical protein
MPRNPDKGTKPRTRDQKKAAQPGARSWLHQAPDWPLYEVLVSKDWQKEEELATVVVARQSPRSGKIAAAAFLVDLGCLGVKSTFVRFCKSPDDYVRRMRNPLMNEQTLQPAEFNLGAKIIREGLAYAESLGFAPDPEYQQASALLSGANPDGARTHVPVGGKDGKPLYIPGPHDNIDQIVATLTRTVGVEGFEQREPDLE